MFSERVNQFRICHECRRVHFHSQTPTDRMGN